MILILNSRVATLHDGIKWYEWRDGDHCDHCDHCEVVTIVTIVLLQIVMTVISTNRITDHNEVITIVTVINLFYIEKYRPQDLNHPDSIAHIVLYSEVLMITLYHILSSPTYVHTSV